MFQIKIRRFFMNYISIFDVIGPEMIGPSSSHTAGAAAMALLARKLFAEEPVSVKFTLYGSFSKTYSGHGTDKALLGGVQGFTASTSSAVVVIGFSVRARSMQLAIFHVVSNSPYSEKIFAKASFV
jgi:iron-sulfur-dependent L-serine dehydratase beta subunit